MDEEVRPVTVEVLDGERERLYWDTIGAAARRRGHVAYPRVAASRDIPSKPPTYHQPASIGKHTRFEDSND